MIRREEEECCSHRRGNLYWISSKLSKLETRKSVIGLWGSQWLSCVYDFQSCVHRQILYFKIGREGNKSLRVEVTNELGNLIIKDTIHRHHCPMMWHLSSTDCWETDRYKVAYYRRRKGKEIAEEDDVENTVEDSNEGGSGASVWKRGFAVSSRKSDASYIKKIEIE